jgi:uncharacterized linocin/CFP29 family protein
MEVEMDMLKRTLAPLTQPAWDEIDGRAQEILKSRLTARKAVKVNGPMGWDYTVLSEGRLDLLKCNDPSLATGIFRVKPLIEVRVGFTLNRWEMDNIIRGAKDIDLTNLDNAVKKIAEFEDNAIYNGYAEGQIKGLDMVDSHDAISFGNNGETIMKAISEGVISLQEHFEQGPFVLIVGEETYKRLNMSTPGYPLINRIESLINGKIILSTAMEGALLIPYNHPNFEMTIGQDFAIGYEYHDKKMVKLFITESFTFRVLDEDIIVRYKTD